MVFKIYSEMRDDRKKITVYGRYVERYNSSGIEILILSEAGWRD